MSLSLGNATFLIHDYDEAIAYFTGVIGFILIEDTAISPSKRRVVVAPKNSACTGLLLAKASTPEQAAAVGNQCAGRVAFFLNTSAFETDYANMKAAGAAFQEEPRSESYGKVAVFTDLYGNRWDLLEEKRG